MPCSSQCWSAGLRSHRSICTAAVLQQCTDPDFAGRSRIIPKQMLKDILPLLKGGGAAFLCHETAECSVLAENLRLLTEAGQQDHETLLNARISEICPSSDGVEILLTGVEQEELVRFNEAYDNFVKAEQAMGPVM